MPLYKFTGPANRHTDFTESVVVETDRDGRPEKYIGVGQVGELEEAEAELFRAAGLKLSEVKELGDEPLGPGFEYLRPDSGNDEPEEGVVLDADDPKKGKADGNAPAADAEKKDPREVAREGGAVAPNRQDKS